MEKTDFIFEDFSNEISIQLKSPTHKSQGFEGIKHFPLIQGKQCLYVMDWSQRAITYKKGAGDVRLQRR